MDFDQLAAPVQRHRARVGSGAQPLPDQVTRNAVKGSGDLNVAIRRDFGMAVGRHLERLHRGRSQPRSFFGGEDLGGALPCGAVHPCSGDVPAPRCGALAAVGQIPELFSGKEIRAVIRGASLHPGLMTRTTHPRRVRRNVANPFGSVMIRR
jgi:hypothetical protein